ncbi:MAG: cache domain-containing protein [Pseudomonadota bacterium]|nr:cache domain-containing protein [Pseudomonadota bacterium]
MNRKQAMTVALTMAAALTAGVSSAQVATMDDAVAMVRKGVASIKVKGKAKTLAEINNPQGSFRARDLYLTVYSKDGVSLAHGANNRMVGTQLLDIRDGDGYSYLRERMEIARTRPVFWQDIKYVNPLTRAVEAKAAYCELAMDMVVCGAVYKL